MSRFSGAALALWLAVPWTASAQDPSDLAAYRALTQTPTAALAPPPGQAIVGARVPGLGFETRYGLRSYDDHEYVHNFGGGIDFPVGAGRMGVVAGYYWPDCDGECDGHFMAGASLSQGIVHIGLGEAPAEAALNIGVVTEAGFGKPPGATLLSGAASLPLTLVPTGGSIRLFPYLSPGMGVGLVDDSTGTEAGIRATFAAGVGLLGLARGLGISTGIERVLLRGGNWLVGVGLRWSGMP